MTDDEVEVWAAKRLVKTQKVVDKLREAELAMREAMVIMDDNGHDTPWEWTNDAVETVENAIIFMAWCHQDIDRSNLSDNEKRGGQRDIVNDPFGTNMLMNKE